MNKPGFATKVIAVLFLLFIFAMALINMGVLKEPFETYKDSKDFSALTENIAQAYRNNMHGRTAFINMNGTYARVSGNRVSNGIIRLKDGSLAEVYGGSDPTDGAEKITELKEYLQDRDIPFLYVQAPRKPGDNPELLPAGTENNTNRDADKAVEILHNNGVSVLDLRPTLLENEESIQKYFYKTDHHWNAEGAFVAYQIITQSIQEQFPEENIVGETTDRNNWQLHTRKNFFLGSHGRRVGIGFAGLDDLIWLTPKFDTDLSCSIPSKRIFRRGPFAESALDTKYMTGNPNYYGSNPYCIHTGTDYPHVQFRNANAPSNLKVLLIKESYGLPVEGFLSTTFQQVDTLDLRHLKNVSALDKIESFDPDIVLVMYNGMAYNTPDFFAFGDMNREVTLSNVVFEGENFLLDAQADNNFRNQKVATVDCGKTYTLTVDSVSTFGNPTDCVGFILYDPETIKTYDTYTADLKFTEESGGKIRWVFTVPDAPEGTLNLLIYPSLPSKTAGIGAEFTGVSLYEGILE